MEEGGAEMRAKGKIRKLRGMLKGTDALRSLMAERARDCAKEEAAVHRGRSHVVASKRVPRAAPTSPFDV